MTMTTCPECKQPISSQAYNCPGCGYPLNKQKRTGLGWGLGCLLTVVALFLVIPVIGLLAAIGIPSFQKARSNSIEKACQNNQRIIEVAKEQCALDNNLTDGITVTENSIGVYIKGGFSSIQCMEQGVYTINPVGVHSECSVHDFPEQY
jgi:RNA polymerase subunit RPABC4/transcription elongation factor Spt4